MTPEITEGFIEDLEDEELLKWSSTQSLALLAYQGGGLMRLSYT